MANEFPDRIVKADNVRKFVGHQLDAIPERIEITLFQHIGQIDNFLDGFVGHLPGHQQTLAQRKIGVRKIGQRFEENCARNVFVQQQRIELVQLENGQIRLQVVGIFACLLVDVVLEFLQMFRIVSVRIGDSVRRCQ